MPQRGEDSDVDGPAIRSQPGGGLTSREREVLTALARGETGNEVAGRLYISPETVRRHVFKSREKLGARSRVHAVVIAIQRGEIAP